MKRVRIFISTGEVSGDLQGAMLIEALHRQADKLGLQLEISALGGDRMAAAGATLLGNTSSISSIGILEALPHILPTLQIQKRAKAYLCRQPPDLMVMIDYMDPNVNIGTYVRQQFPKLPMAYFIAPQQWVWAISPEKTRRIVAISDRMLAIFPAEAKYYQSYGAAATFVGHPLADRMQQAPDRAEARTTLGIPAEQTAIVLLPASRPQEIQYLMPVMFQAAQTIQQQIPQAHFWIPLSLEQYRSPIAQSVADYGLSATILDPGDPLTAIAAADVAITKSGTVNLEMAYLDVPQVVMYRVNPLTAWVAKHLLKFSLPFMSPPNLVEMKQIVPEFLQDEATPEKIAAATLELLQPDRRHQVIQGYQAMRQSLGPAGVCDRAAQDLLKLVAPM